MTVIDYCANSTILPLWNHGMSECFYHTIQPAILFLLSVVAMLYHRYLKWRAIQKCKRMFSRSKSQDSQKIGLIQADCVEAVPDVELECRSSEDCKKCFRDFPFSKLPLPFLYVFQLILHSFLMILPVIQIIVKIIINNEALSGAQIMSCILNLLAWILGFHTLKHERGFHYMNKIKHHSIGMLSFWTIALILELLLFTTWNNENSLFKNFDDGTKVMNVVVFAFRITSNILLFILGFHAPGMYKSKVASLDSKNKTSAKKSSWSDLWDKTKRLWPFIWPKNNWLRLRVLVCLGLLAMGRVLNVFVPVYNKKIVNYLTDTSNKTDPWKLITVYVMLQFMQGGGGGSMGVLNNLRSFLWIKVQQYTSRSVQTELFEHLHTLSLRWHVGRKTGEVIRMVDRGSTSIESLLSYILFQILPTIVDICVALVFFGTAFNGWFAFIVFVTMVFYIGATIGVTEWRTKYRRAMNEKDNTTKAVAVDSLLNFETVKYYNNEEFEVNRYGERILDYQGAQWMAQVSLNLLNTSQNLVINLGSFAGMMYCGTLVVNGHLSVGDFVLFLAYLRQLYMPLNFFGTYYRLIQAAFIDMENMFDLMEQEIEIYDSDDAAVMTTNHGLVEFKDVRFHYDERKPVLRGITFTVLPGTTTALVGPSGSGKSTIIRLLFRFYDIMGGSILIDGQDIRQVTQKSLRQGIGVVPQDTVLFNDTIRYNIAYGRVNCTDTDVKEAAGSSDIHMKITTFPEQYETMVGERGLKLSGGEKQRVAIARTLLKAPDIVLLDEATSALDTQTERNIQASLNRVCANKTTIVVAHRLSTVIGADQIIVLKDGLIAEKGRHLELLDKGGLYYSMWHQQLEDHNGGEE